MYEDRITVIDATVTYKEYFTVQATPVRWERSCYTSTDDWLHIWGEIIGLFTERANFTSKVEWKADI